MAYSTLFLLVVLLLFGLPVAADEPSEDAPQPELVNFDRLWNFSKPDETEKRFRELLPAAEASGNLDYHLQLLTQIARTQGLQKKDEARALFLEAWNFGTKEKADYYALDAAHMMEIVEPKEHKLGWNEKAMKLAETSKDERCKLWLGALYNNRGWALFELGRYEEALTIHQKGLAWRKERGQPKPILIARWSVARMKRALGRYTEALAEQEALLAAWTELGEKDGFVHEELAENLLAVGRPDEARPHFVTAWELLQDQTWIKDSEPERWVRLRKMAGADEEDDEEDEEQDEE